ncbi:MAG: hypothetical protein ACKVN9_06200 [Methylophilaceae bacterium]
MNKAAKYAEEDEAWDNGTFGTDEKHVKRVEPALESAINDALGLQMISIRLQKKLIKDLKFIATAHGIGYQPLIRDILSRFVTHETKQIIRDTIERRKLDRKLEEKYRKDSSSTVTSSVRQKKVA